MPSTVFCLFFSHILDESLICVCSGDIEEFSICSRWALGLWGSSYHQEQRVEHTATFFFVFLYYRYENWMGVSFFDVRWGNDECSVCVRWALKNLKFITSSGTKGGIHSTLVLFTNWRYANWASVPFYFRWGVDDVSIFCRWSLRRLSFLTS